MIHIIIVRLLLSSDSDCVEDHIMCADGTFVSRNPFNCDEFLPCPEPPVVNPPLPPSEDCPTDGEPDFITICINILSIPEMNGEYQGPVPLDHNPFQYGFYHVNSPLDSLGNRRWFIATDLSKSNSLAVERFRYK